MPVPVVAEICSSLEKNPISLHFFLIMEILLESPIPTKERLLEAVQNTLKKIALMNEGIEMCRQTLAPDEDENEDITIWSYKKMKQQMTDDLLNLLQKMDLHFRIEETRQAV